LAGIEAITILADNDASGTGQHAAEPPTSRERQQLNFPVFPQTVSADSEEKHEPVSDIDTAAADSLKVLDLKRPIREADIDW